MGVDIVNVMRIEKVVDRFGKKFVERILSKEEISQIADSGDMLCPKFLAKRFAAKESISKALGVGIGQIGFKQITIKNDDLGKPIACIANLKQKIEISISDDYPYAICFAVAIVD